LRLSNFRTFHQSGKLRGFELVVLAGLMITGINSYAKRAIAQSTEVRDETLRLHIIANSDSEEDQALKLKVRDRILEETGELFAEVNGKSDAVALTKISLNKIEALAEDVIAEEGAEYDVSVALTEDWFETRSYDGFTLPAGEYDTVRIVIGAGEGANWWCVMYPPLCVSSATDAAEAYGEDEAFVTGSKYEVRFAVVELYERIKKVLSDP